MTTEPRVHPAGEALTMTDDGNSLVLQRRSGGCTPETFTIDFQDRWPVLAALMACQKQAPFVYRCDVCDHTIDDHVNRPRNERVPPKACMRGTGDGSVCSCSGYVASHNGTR